MKEEYQILRRMEGKKIAFYYDTGAKIVGIITKCLPEQGPVELIIMREVEIIASSGKLLEKHDIFSMVPNLQTFFTEIR